MPKITRTLNKKISINLKGTIDIPNNDATVLLIGHRIGVLSGAVPDYNLFLAKACGYILNHPDVLKEVTLTA